MHKSIAVLDNFDLYPFVVVGSDSKGFVIYKNYMTEKLCPKIRIGAKINIYADISLDEQGFVTGNFYGNKNISYLCDIEYEGAIYKLMIVFSEGCCRDFLSGDRHNPSYDQAIREILNNPNDSESACERRAYLRHIIKKSEQARIWGTFVSRFLNNADNELTETFSINSAVRCIANIVKNRLLSDICLECEYDVSDTFYDGNRREFLVLFLNSLNFAFINSVDQKVNISISTENNITRLNFEFAAKSDIIKIYKNNAENTSIQIINLITGIDVAYRSGSSYKIKFDNKRCTLSVLIHTTKCPSSFIFSSSNYFERIINEFMDFFIVLKDSEC